ncbi:helix-turn-helix domain-containing protein [Robertkochia solimangrovi]|uniref:helix-turn-helix domain-containing protein n=1 Tax=Robertkochia solimangrovi TaxID=2213046 RepID=UPI00117C8AA2|nr:helix-turn-helix transcriptional regulator [Robertkochia solimangrovi]TRZ41674.1 hypothetical protein DMZ48_16845 [Robertkochia solimangrovi]
MDLGKVIKLLRKKQGLNQKELASRCGLSQTYLSLIEGNRKEPNLATLKAIANELNVSLPILFFMSLGKEDVPESKREMFEILEPTIKDLIKQIYSK